MKRALKWAVVLIVILGALVGDPVGHSSEGAVMANATTEYLPNGDGHYNYAPAIIRTNEAEYAWWCQNPKPYEVTDHIFYSKRPLGGEWEPRRSVLAPGEPGAWDSIPPRACRPISVRCNSRRPGSARAL